MKVPEPVITFFLAIFSLIPLIAIVVGFHFAFELNEKDNRAREATYIHYQGTVTEIRLIYGDRVVILDNNNAIGGAILGGLVAGHTGAIVGSIAGSGNNSSNVESNQILGCQFFADVNNTKLKYTYASKYHQDRIIDCSLLRVGDKLSFVWMPDIQRYDFNF